MARSEITTTPLMRWPSFSLFLSSYHCRTDARASLNHSHTPYAQSIKKGTAYMNIVMYAIHELQSAISKCPNDRAASGHAWDEGCAPLLSRRCCRAVVVVACYARMYGRERRRRACCCGALARCRTAERLPNHCSSADYD